MAHYVISDIHGESDRFYEMLKKIQLAQEDTLFILGDVIDRGPDGIPLLLEIMGMSNAVMLLGNHEHMMLQYLSPGATEKEIRRWDRNGNLPTLHAFGELRAKEQQRILDYLTALPTHIEIEVNERPFYLVHGFPGENGHDEVWGRPELDTPNPRSGSQVVIGHTPVLRWVGSEEIQRAYISGLESRGGHLKIIHAPGFIDIDCGCGHYMPGMALACMRLEDMAEYYCC